MNREDMILTDQVRDEVMTLYSAGGNDDFKDDMKSIVLIDSLLELMETTHQADQNRIKELSKSYEELEKKCEEYKSKVEALEREKEERTKQPEVDLEYINKLLDECSDPR